MGSVIMEYMEDVQLRLGVQADMEDHPHQAQLILEPVVHQTTIGMQEDLHLTGKLMVKQQKLAFNNS